MKCDNKISVFFFLYGDKWSGQLQQWYKTMDWTSICEGGGGLWYLYLAYYTSEKSGVQEQAYDKGVSHGTDMTTCQCYININHRMGLFTLFLWDSGRLMLSNLGCLMGPWWTKAYHFISKFNLNEDKWERKIIYSLSFYVYVWTKRSIYYYLVLSAYRL